MSDSESNGRVDRKPAVGGYEGPVDEKFAEYVGDLLRERDSLDPEQFPMIRRLVENELNNISKGATGVGQEPGFVDLYSDTPITLYVKAMPPSKVFPKFNYAGRIIGPKGTYLKALMKETMTKMVLLGKGVMKDKDKEEELRRSQDPKYYHLHEDMHVAIQVTAPASEAYARVAYALKCLKQQVLSDNRSLEDLPWIAATGTKFFGTDPHGGKEVKRFSPPPPVPVSRPSYPPRRVAAEYAEEGYPYAYEYMREPPSPSHTSTKAPYYAPSYSRLRPPTQSEQSRAMEYVDKFRPLRAHDTRGYSPGPRPVYDYGHSTPVYEQDTAHHHQHYYDDARASSYASTEQYSAKLSERSAKSAWPPTASQSQRYAPYTKKY